MNEKISNYLKKMNEKIKNPNLMKISLKNE
jgi:hypothetical protein